MNPQQVVEDAKKKFSAAVEHYHEQLKTLRTGRASASMLDGVMVEAYGTPMPLNQVANVIAPEAQLLQITPFDPNNLQKIASAIRDNPSLGLNPSDDGRVVRLPIPSLTEERRRDIVKQLGSKQEDAMIAIRNIRHEAMDALDAAKKDKVIGEDDAKRLSTQVEEAMQKTRTEIEAATKGKEVEIMKV
ncbi:ribosome recycling factor [Candidatus Saccharibacteria bacterium]|nr:MAG: ribosome recycling factor [Candidatus Saccharibacteria bacterium]